MGFKLVDEIILKQLATMPPFSSTAKQPNWIKNMSLRLLTLILKNLNSEKIPKKPFEIQNPLQLWPLALEKFILYDFLLKDLSSIFWSDGNTVSGHLSELFYRCFLEPNHCTDKKGCYHFKVTCNCNDDFINYII